MKSFIEEFYYGNIDPQDCGSEQNRQVQHELQTISANEDYLNEHLSGKDKKRFLDYADAWSAFNRDSTLDSFVIGFRLRAWFMMNTFLRDDYSTVYL